MQLIPIPCSADSSGSDNLPASIAPFVTPAIVEMYKMMQSLYERRGFHEPWVGYLAIKEEKCVGTCAFTSAPNESGVEIAYHTFAEFEGRGIATEMARELIALARRTQPDILIRANTLKEMNASTSILKKLGFTLYDTAIDPDEGEVWEWRLRLVRV